MLLPVTFRKYNASDKPAVMDLLDLNTPVYFAASERSGLDEYLDRDSGNYYVLLLGDAIVGSGGFNITDDLETVYLSWDIIHPRFHNKGLGSGLMRHRLKEIENTGTLKTLIVRTSQLAYPFYQKFGFETETVVPGYRAEGFDLYKMTCPAIRIAYA